jgi:hypothetical protein
MDALVYAEINNNLTNQELVQDLANQANINSSNLNDIQNRLNQYLDDTTIKRACCMGRAGPNKGDGSTGINVKIPIPDGYNLNQDINKNLETQFQYIEKTVYVPQEMCDPQWQKFQPYCDNFMNVYCANQAKAFTDLNNGNFDQGTWKLYAKECSCYAPPNPSYASAPHTCYMNGCAEGDPGVYVDPSSRGKQCDMTVCTSILNAAGIQAGGSANINSQVEQNCGSAIAKRAQEQATAAAGQELAMKSQTQSGTAVQPASQLAPQPTPPSPSTSDTPKSEDDFFTKYKTAIIITIIVLLVCCCSSSVFMFMRRKND